MRRETRGDITRLLVTLIPGIAIFAVVQTWSDSLAALLLLGFGIWQTWGIETLPLEARPPISKRRQRAGIVCLVCFPIVMGTVLARGVIGGEMSVAALLLYVATFAWMSLAIYARAGHMRWPPPSPHREGGGRDLSA